MKIGIITGEFPPMPGGVGDFSRLLGERLQALGHAVHILSRAGSQSETLPLHTVSGWGAAAIPQIRSWVRRHQLDIVNLQYQTAAFDMSPLAHFWPGLLPAPFVTTFHDLRHPYLFPKAGPLRDWIVHRLARASSGVITTNHEDHRSLGTLPKRRLIPLGSSIPRLPADGAQRAELRRQAGADDGCMLLGHFGFIKAIKGVHHLLEALESLLAAGVDLRLVFIGARSNAVDNSEDARYLTNIERRIQRTRLVDAVHFTDPLPAESVAAWMQAVDLMTLPFSDGASFRRSSLIAALHQGCATLSTEPAFSSHDFTHRRNLWLVARNSACDIEAALAELMRQPPRLEQLRNGAKELSRRFEWDAVVSETTAFFESILA